MSSAGSSVWTRTVAIGIVVMAGVIGNVSLSASEIAGTAVSSGAPVRSTDSRPASPDVLPVASTPPDARFAGMGYSNFDFAVAGVDRGVSDRLPADSPDAPVSADSGQVVPAIYAWDPDVRFVFYRHVSKWM